MEAMRSLAVWLVGGWLVEWSLRAFVFRQRPGRPDGERLPDGSWVLRYTSRHGRLWLARLSVLGLLLPAALLLGLLTPMVDGSVHPDAFVTALMAGCLLQAAQQVAMGMRGRILLDAHGMTVRHAVSEERVAWPAMRKIKRFDALDGWAVLSRGKAPVFLSLEMHGLGRFVREFQARAPSAARESDLSRFPPAVGGS